MSTLGRKIGALLFAAAGVVALATPASAGNDQPQLFLPWTVKAGTKAAVLYGNCVDEHVKSFTSEGFVGGKAEVIPNFNSAKGVADIVDKPGTYVVSMTCDGYLGTSRKFTVVP